MPSRSRSKRSKAITKRRVPNSNLDKIRSIIGKIDTVDDLSGIAMINEEVQNTELREKIYKALKERNKRLKQIFDSIYETAIKKFATNELNPSELLKNIEIIANNKLSDSMKPLFFNYISERLRYNTSLKKFTIDSVNVQPVNDVGSLLGYRSDLWNATTKMNPSVAKTNEVMKIINLYQSTKDLHNILIQSAIFFQHIGMSDKIQDFFIKFVKLSKDQFYYSNVIPSISGVTPMHPLIVMMFLSQIASIDVRYLLASLPEIVYTKAMSREGLIVKAPNTELFSAISTDPNDKACNIENPLEDLYNRSILQVSIWNAVKNLRSGKLLVPQDFNLQKAIEACKRNYTGGFIFMLNNEIDSFGRVLSALAFNNVYISLTDSVSPAIVPLNNFNQNTTVLDAGKFVSSNLIYQLPYLTIPKIPKNNDNNVMNLVQVIQKERKINYFERGNFRERTYKVVSVGDVVPIVLGRFQYRYTSKSVTVPNYNALKRMYNEQKIEQFVDDTPITISNTMRQGEGYDWENAFTVKNIVPKENDSDPDQYYYLSAVMMVKISDGFKLDKDTVFGKRFERIVYNFMYSKYVENGQEMLYPRVITKYTPDKYYNPVEFQYTQLFKYNALIEYDNTNSKQVFAEYIKNIAGKISKHGIIF